MYSKYGYLDPQDSQNGSEYEQEESQLMIQQTDPFYQPTKKEIQEYATELLNMNLPEDDHLLYLARQAMKAPMPDCWETYQRANGDIYYKHKVTQQKLVEHPIEIQYRKKYQQEKEKAARKTLKSKIPLKNLAGGPSGMGGGKVVLGGLGGIGGTGKSSNQIGWGESTNQMKGLIKEDQTEVSIKNDSQFIFEDNTEITKKFDKQLQQLEQNLKKKLNTLKANEQDSYYAFEKRAKNNHNEEMQRLKSEGQKDLSFQQRLRNEKKRVSSQLDQQFEQNFKRQKLSVQNTLEQNLRNNEVELQASYNKKIIDDESEFQRKIELKQKELQQYKSQIENQKQKLESKFNTQLQEIKKSLVNSKSIQINQQLESRLRKITQEIDAKLRVKSESLQQQFIKISNSIKGTSEDKIQQMVRQKLNLQQLSNKKIQMAKQKQKKTIDQEINIQFLEQKNKLRKNIQAKQLQMIKKLEQSLNQQQEKEIENKTKQYEQKWKVLEAQIYSTLKDKIQDFQLKKNKNIISIRQSFIKQIEQKAQNLQYQNATNTIKMQIDEKKFQIQNKLKFIENIKKQIDNIDFKLKRVNFCRKLFRTKDKNQITNILKKHLESKKIEIRQLAGESQEQINFINQALSEHVTQLKQAKKQLQSDKSLLLKVFKHLQSNTILPSYQKRKAADSMTYSSKIQHISYSTNELLAKYNKDVKLMRQNAKRIQQYQDLIKRVEVDEIDVSELQNYELEYMIPELREELGRYGMNQKPGIEEVGNKTVVGGKFNLKEIGGHNTDLISTKNVRQMFNEHSKFLSGVKNELNQKLAQIRSGSQFY